MTSFKRLFLAVVFALTSFTSFAQQNKAEQIATEKVEQLNAIIVKGSPGAGLTEEQKEQIYEIQLKRIKELKEKKEDFSNKEEFKVISKELNKKYYKEIFQKVMTKEQRMAHKKGKQNKAK